MRAPILALVLAAGPALAQPQAGHHGRHAPNQPYAGLETRAVKALSEQDLADLRAGRGMGLALAAELNGYPGPMHVLEHADRLGLTAEQRRRVEGLFDGMKGEAIALGEALIARETELDRLFAARTVTPAALAAATRAVGEAQAALREAHLKAHLRTAEALSPGQAEAYARLRGYRP